MCVHVGRHRKQLLSLLGRLFWGSFTGRVSLVFALPEEEEAKSSFTSELESGGHLDHENILTGQPNE